MCDSAEIETNFNSSLGEELRYVTFTDLNFTSFNVWLYRDRNKF